MTRVLLTSKLILLFKFISFICIIFLSQVFVKKKFAKLILTKYSVNFFKLVLTCIILRDWALSLR